MTAKTLIGAELHVLGTATATFTGTTETALDFGTPNDLDLANTAAYEHGDRVLIVLTADTAGTTDSLTVLVYDADDNAGSIGTPAAAVVDHPHADYDLTGGTGNHIAVASVQLQAGRPWLRVALDASGATDSWEVHAIVLGVPTGL